MATQEKLQKSLDALKSLSKQNQQSADAPKKIQHCYVITEAISNPTIRVSTIFPTLLGSSIEAFLKLCDDNDADVRMTSEECLNRIIRASTDSHIRRIQIELHKEIKQNGSARSLRAALWLFSVLADHIKPHKGKPYVVNLFPSIIKISERNEESVHETLAASMPKIMKALGCFTSESEMKVLLKAFLTNIGSESAVIRRTKISSIFSICTNCRNPHFFIIYSLNYLMDLLIPVNGSESNSLILGVISGIKALIPSIKLCELKDNENEKLLQAFELCLHYLSHKDHNIVNVCLETLNALIQNCTEFMKNKFLTEMGPSKIFSPLPNNRSSSQLSMSTNTTTGDENIFPESELTETLRSDIGRWVDESKLSIMNINFAKSRDKSFSLEKINNFNTGTVNNSDVYDYGKINELSKDFVSKLKTHSFGDNLDILSGSENSLEKSLSGSSVDKIMNDDSDILELDIGDLSDSPPILYCTRLIVKSFLLNGTPGNYISDKLVRVSVKYLALTCLSTIFHVFPTGIFASLDKNFDGDAKVCGRKVSCQKISDILIFRVHSDPQLRGAVRNLVAKYIKTVSLLCEGGYDAWLRSNANPEEAEKLSVENLVAIFLEGLQDKSFACVKQSLISLSSSLKYLIESENCTFVTPLLNYLPVLTYNPYWLVKVALCELVSKVDYVTINFVIQSDDFQQKVIYNLLFKLIGDSDQRVRSAAASAFNEIIPNLYFKEYQQKGNPTTLKAILESDVIFKNLTDFKGAEAHINKRHFIGQMPFPFSEITKKAVDRIEFSLSKILKILCNALLTTTSKHFINGCIETLCLLSNSYPCTVYRNSWCINDFNKSEEISKTKVPDLLRLTISLLADSVHVYDITSHTNILKLALNLYAGNALVLTKPLVDPENSTTLWSMFANENFKELSEQFLCHIVKLLNIFHHVLNDFLPVHPQAKVALPNLPLSSPLKRRKSDLDKRSLIATKTDKDEKNNKKDGMKSVTVGTFSTSSHYLKIFDILKSAFNNYKISLDSDSSQTFLDLLNTNLQCISVLMEIGSLYEFSRIAEDILTYFRSTFIVDAPSTVQAVQQLLKSLIATNLTANIVEFSKKDPEIEDIEEGFFYNIFQKPYVVFTQNIACLNKIALCEIDDETVMGYLHRKDARRRSVVLTKRSDKILESYIRLFEPMVIKSLEQYTITSDVRLQCKVLQLLSQLVQLRVNYCLLDSEQVFIGYVLKQFEFIEEGQIPFAEELIPRIFQFLVQLSYSKQHSKCIISVPKIIQLCDGLMASGQPSSTHCIPALEPIVEDIFLTRNKSNTSDMKELETTREVILSMLLRLCENKQVIDLITLILNDSRYCTDNTEKWYDWSKRVATVVLPMLNQKKLKIENSDALISLRQFILALNPEVFKPFDDIILMFFDYPPVSDLEKYNSWLSKIIILLMIITTLKEEALLSKINRLKSNFSPATIYDDIKTKADPLNVNSNADTFDKVPAELIFAKFLLKIISATSEECLKAVKIEDSSFITEQFSTFLVNCLYIFQAGSHCKIVQMTTSVFNKNIPLENHGLNFRKISDNFYNLGFLFPTLAFHWNSFLTIINYNNMHFLTKVFGDERSECGRLNFTSLNLEIMKMGATVSACDYMGENMEDSELIQWFIDKNTKSIVSLFTEPPVGEFVSSIHRYPQFSRMLISNLTKEFTNTDSLLHRINILKCAENCHSSQISSVLNLLIPNILNCRQAAVSRMAANLACRKIELLLTLSMEEVTTQMSKENLLDIQKALLTKNMFKRYETLVSLLNKLSAQYYDLSPIELQQRRIVNAEHVKKLKINKKWYLSQIQSRYDDVSVGRETAELLKELEYNEMISFMSSSGFNKFSLKYCFRLGLSQFHHNKFHNNDLIRASVDCLLKDITCIVSRITQTHQVCNGDLSPTSSLEESYKQIFMNEDFSDLQKSIAECIPYFIQCLHSDVENKITDNNIDEVMKFGAICMMYISFLKTSPRELSIHCIDIFLTATDSIFKNCAISKLLGFDCNVLWFCSSVNSLYQLVQELLKCDRPLPSIPHYSLEDSIKNVETQVVGEAAYHLYILTCWLYENKAVNQTKIPDCLYSRIKSLIVCLSRLPIVNSYILIPQCSWKTGWHTEPMGGTFKTQVPQLPIDLLQELDILEEYIFRIALLGWTSRQQFEETWMCLLSVLCQPLDNVDVLVIDEVIQASSLAIQSITSLLLKTLCCCDPGNPNVFNLVHVSRNAPLLDGSVCITKLKNILDSIEHNYQSCISISQTERPINVFNLMNFEKCSNKYGYGQVSIKYCLLMTDCEKHSEDNSIAAEICRQRKKMLLDNGLDINSCLQFLIDYFPQLMKPQMQLHLFQPSTHIRIVHEVIRSIVMISDLFMDKSQFQWMLDVFLELVKLHTVEDELLHQYLIIGICKSVAVLTPELDVYEQAKKLLVQYLKSPYLSSRIASLYGILYILEGSILNNITIGGLSEEMLSIIPCAVEYVQYNLNANNVLKKSQEHSSLVWSLAFYLLENIDETHMETNFVTNTIMSAFTTLRDKTNGSLHQSIMKGLERLLIMKKSTMLERFGKHYLKLALEKMKQDNPIVAMSGTQLLLSYMYIDCKDHLQNPQASQNAQTNPEHLVQTIEKISAIFERIKRGYVYEIEILCTTLPLILDDLFAPSDILTKVIGEFLSPQQPHPKLLSKVVFQVFHSAITKEQLSLLQDWVVFSLSNFTQSCSIGMATWCLTCFFISASTNRWLRSYFPYVQTRVGRYEYEDKKILCIAAADFYRNLSNDKQRQTFVDSFTKVKDQPDTPFSDLLLSL